MEGLTFYLIIIFGLVVLGGGCRRVSSAGEQSELLCWTMGGVKMDDLMWFVMLCCMRFLTALGCFLSVLLLVGFFAWPA